MNSNILDNRNMVTEVQNNAPPSLSRTINSDLLISVIIPVYNEENSITDVINKIPNHRNYEIILIDDGSTDKSVLKIKEIEKDNIILLQHQKNLGYGAALITGFKNATGKIIVTLDSDGQHKPEEIEKMIIPILQDKADLVIGSRYLGDCDYKVPIYTRIGEYFIKLCFLMLFRQKIGNNQSGYRCFKKEVIKSIHDTISVGMGFTTEFLFKAGLKNFKIMEVPITLNPRNHGCSYVKLFKLLKTICVCILINFFKKKSQDFNKLLLKKWFNQMYRILSYLNKYI